MDQKLNIPKKIKVGFVNRNDTYTNKLAYVIYYDYKNNLRKQTSWENWRDKSIPSEDFDNKPTSGFVLNKSVGGYKSHWYYRSSHIRVYDPRGFEIEISVENLLFILQETSSMKDKGLEGEFVYAWDNKDLVLLPVCSDIYKSSSEHTLLQLGKVSAKQIHVGHTYIHKDGTLLVYLGRFDVTELVDFERLCWQREFYLTKRKKHVFYCIDGNKRDKYLSYRPKYYNGKFYITNGFTDLAGITSTEVFSDFDNILEEYNKSMLNTSLYFKIKECPITDNNKYEIYKHCDTYCIKDGDIYYKVILKKKDATSVYDVYIKEILKNDGMKLERERYYVNYKKNITEKYIKDNCMLLYIELSNGDIISSEL